jgi:hypothetical protein
LITYTPNKGIESEEDGKCGVSHHCHAFLNSSPVVSASLPPESPHPAALPVGHEEHAVVLLISGREIWVTGGGGEGWWVRRCGDWSVSVHSGGSDWITGGVTECEAAETGRAVVLFDGRLLAWPGIRIALRNFI